MFFKAPGTYICATIHQNILLFYPLPENDMPYVYLEAKEDYYTTPLFSLAGFSSKIPFIDMKEFYKYIMLSMFSFSVIGVLSHPSTYILLCLFLLVLAMVKKINIFILPMIPILFSLLACILAPTVYTHPRYSFPILYSTPVLLAWFITLYPKDQS